MTDLLALLASHGFAVVPDFSGQPIRFDRSGKGTGWFIGHAVAGQAEPGEGGAHATLYWARFGDWKTDESYEWQSSEAPEHLAAFKAAKAAADRETEERQERAAESCQALWESAIELGERPYLTKKLGGPHGGMGTRLDPANPSITLVPAYDLEGRLWNLQRITPDGEKRFTPGARVKGTFFYMGPNPKEAQELYLCEGAATAASIYLALRRQGQDQDICVISCFNAANLKAVAEALWAADNDSSPGASTVTRSVTVCADNDQWTVRPNGTPWNPGLEWAEKAADLLGGRVIYPSFTSLDGRPTDFNDLHQREGLAEVLAQLTAEEVVEPGALGRGPRALPPRQGAKGQPLAPTQQAIVEHLVAHFQGNLLKQDKDLFWYTGTHWQWLRAGEHDRIKQLIQEVAGGRLGYGDIVACFGLLMTFLPCPPVGVDMFLPTGTCANFLNGTLHLVPGARDARGRMELRFHPHRREDFLLNVLPYEYREGDTTRNPEFDAMLERLWAGDRDASEKKRALAQMFGACLMPAFPRLFMLHGKSGSGKSTVLQIARRLVSAANVSQVPPSEFHGFNMESMAGKLVNIDTDIPLDQPIRDDVVKKILERRPVRVRRKGIRDIDAHIPAVHLFGGNAIPRALDGVSGAHTRRWTFLEFQRFQPSGQYLLEYWDYCYDAGPQGILNFALEGLRDLCANGGHFTQPESGAAKVAEWQLASDPIGLFLADLDQGEIVEGQAKLIRGPGCSIPRSRLWEAFRSWSSNYYPGGRVMGRNHAFDGFRQKGFSERQIKGIHHFVGIGQVQGDEIAF